MRVLFYAVNGLGLGHLTRLLGLARALRALRPDVEILFVTSSEAAHLVYNEGFAGVKVPSRNAASRGGLRRGTFLRLTQSLVWNALTAFDPHCLVVDTFPSGTLQELLPILKWPMRKVFVFRAQKAERAEDALLQNALRCYDLILVPHAQGEEDVPLPPESRGVWTGTMLCHGPDEMLPRDVARRRLGLPPEGVCALLTLGGGGEPDMIAARELLQAALPRVAGVTWWEARGPLSVNEAEDVAAPPWLIGRGVHPLMLYLPAFDFALSAAGYNTTNELQAARLPCALWPFARGADEQAARVAKLAQSGRALAVGEGVAPGRETEIEAVVNNLSRPETCERLRAAMSQGGAFANGTTAGARAILELFRG